MKIEIKDINTITLIPESRSDIAIIDHHNTQLNSGAVYQIDRPTRERELQLTLVNPDERAREIEEKYEGR